MTPNQLPPLPEPDSYQFQHDETGQTMFVDRQQVEWGFEANNPRLHKIGGAFTADQMHAYTLAALAQQAQEPVAWMLHLAGKPRCASVSKPSLDGYHPDFSLRPLVYGDTTPPAPQMPAPDIDEAALARMTKLGAEAWAGVDVQALREGGQPAPVDERIRLEARRAAELIADTLQSQAPQAGGWLLIESAPKMGVVLLLVEHEEERRVMVAEASSEDGGGWYWMKTHGWTGWSRLHGSWTPIGWQPLPQAPQTKGQP